MRNHRNWSKSQELQKLGAIKPLEQTFHSSCKKKKRKKWPETHQISGSSMESFGGYSEKPGNEAPERNGARKEAHLVRWRRMGGCSELCHLRLLRGGDRPIEPSLSFPLSRMKWLNERQIREWRWRESFVLLLLHTPADAWPGCTGENGAPRVVGPAYSYKCRNAIGWKGNTRWWSSCEVGNHLAPFPSGFLKSDIQLSALI